VLAGIPRGLPEWQRALKLQKRAATVGFDWPDVEGALEKVREELDELRAAPTPEEREGEFGDLLFTMVNVARKLGITPEDALRSTTRRFEARFRLMEAAIRRDGRVFAEMPIEELDRYWEGAKREE